MLVLATLTGCAQPAPPNTAATPEKAAADNPPPSSASQPPNAVGSADDTDDRGRPEDDIARDSLRKPQAVMDFFGVGSGSRVVELMAGGGYYVDLLSRRVGPKGSVWAHNTPFVLERFAERRIAERLDNPKLANVRRLDTELEDPQLPPNLDAVMIVLFYHDLYWQKVDRAATNEAIFAALKPGGVYGVIDHAALEGHGSDDVKSLHRVEESVVTKEILAAGFVLEERSDLLANADDPRDYNVFAPPDGRDRTDRFVLRFVKPKS